MCDCIDPYLHGMWKGEDETFCGIDMTEAEEKDSTNNLSIITCITCKEFLRSHYPAVFL